MLRKLLTWNITLKSYVFIAVYSFFTLLIYNFGFWNKIIAALNFQNVSDLLFLLTYFVTLFAVFFLLFNIFFIKYTAKLFASIFLLVNSGIAYFIAVYNVPIDKGMLLNAFATDVHEVSNLLHVKMILYVFVLGILPALILLKIHIIYDSFLKELWLRPLLCFIIFAFAFTLVGMQYRQIATFARTTHGIFDYLTPTNYLDALIKIVRQSQYKAQETVYINQDFVVGSDNTLVLFIVGETARKHNFSLYGYPRETNPLLKKDQVIALPDVYSCGTATRISLPCIFSHLGRIDYLNTHTKYEFFPQALAAKGVQVLYKDNNFGGCKGTCNGTEHISTVNAKLPEFCATGECMDGILLEGLPQYIEKHQGNTLIVLHQNGSHGPRYNKRYPKVFEQFRPVCDSSDVRECTREELINAYDNTILYTDYLIHQTINIAEKTNRPAVVIYVSDHGESLGEKGLYLHGFPYALAPEEQKKVPLVIWMSQAFQDARDISNACLANKTAYSHDHIFHSMLGLFQVQTKLYEPGLDIFAECNL